MDRDPGDFAPQDGGSSDQAGDDELDAAIAEARADRAAGRGVPHVEVAKWLRTWGTPDFKPMPDEWLR